MPLAPTAEPRFCAFKRAGPGSTAKPSGHRHAEARAGNQEIQRSVTYVLDRRSALGSAAALLHLCGSSTAVSQAAEGAQCFMEIAVDGESRGRVVIEMLDPGSLGARRFADLCKGIRGVGYRRSKFDTLFEVRCSGLQVQLAHAVQEHVYMQPGTGGAGRTSHAVDACNS